MSKFAKLALPVEKPARMFIVHPITRQKLVDEKGNPAYIDLFSTDSSEARRHDREAYRRRSNIPQGIKLTAEEIEAETASTLAALTVGWHLVGQDGVAVDVPLSPENARELYSEPGLSWLREQVDFFVRGRANFTNASSKR